MSKKILIIDDYADSGKTLMMAMKKLGHEVQWVKDGPSALNKISAFVPDIVLCDICMPGMLGYDVCRKMKADPRLKDTMFIAQTGIDSDSGKQRAQDAGFDHHMIKPVDLTELASLIAAERSSQPLQTAV